MSIFAESSFRKGNQPPRVLVPPTAAVTFNSHLREKNMVVYIGSCLGGATGVVARLLHPSAAEVAPS